jgi:hypothetical protein
MAGIVTNIIQNSLSGFVAGAVTTVGGYAGDAVGGVGNLIERGGQSVGDGISKAFRNYGDSINGYGTAARNATAPNGSSPAPKTVAKRLDQPGKGERKKELPTTAKKALPSSTVGTQKMLTYPGYGAAPRPGLGGRKSSTETVKTVKSKTGDSNAGAKYTPYGGSGRSYAAPDSKKTGQLPKTGGKVVPEKRSKPGSKPPPSALSSTYAPSDAGSTVSGYKGPLPSIGGANGPRSTIGGYRAPDSTVGVYKKEPSKPATDPDKLKAKNVAAGGAKAPAPPRGPALPEGVGGGGQRIDGKVRISRESRPKRN